MKRILSWIMGSLMLVLLSGCSLANQRLGTKQSTLIVGLDDSYVPMGYETKSGNLEGFDVDLAKMVGQTMHRKIVFQPIDWSMKETELRNRTIDLIWNGYSKTPPRAKKVAFSKPYLTNQQVIVVQRKSNIRKVKDLQNQSVGTQSGSASYTKIIQNPSLLKDFIKNKTPVQYDSLEQGMLDLNAGRIKGFMIDSVFADYYVKHTKNPQQYRILQTQFTGEDFAVGMRKDDSKTRKEINQALYKLKQIGKLQQLQQKWFAS
ncbi:amino acid ABC transporter substrate-binding protein [Bombilactobacillus thymidiniphilus]|uniref:Amino acid ABC transporter substrate-binding protein n=1 Tax=Bombilactobacillus thymidiniphilus TaxID=2923363 RepID=A0ABY4PDR4_9LACO|nr:amino acid ABC transporter substrate-binding protein [Bombilactobacillus thymidiniphilus]UQS83819.1 amino acid ABC transporter substrate-binding protein [Bombilactobacillus thymidiniphilus]